jgi:ABC-type transport system involved in multi-copper enzyme maturation permease subunit
MNKNSMSESTRIILAIAGKDISEALKSRTLLTVAIGVLLLMLTGPVLSLLVNRSQPVLVLFAPDSKGIFQTLEQRNDMRLVLADSQAELESTILQSTQTILGVAVMSELTVEPEEEFTVEGYYAHWVTESRLRERVAFFESALSLASGKILHIDTDDHRLFPSQADSSQFSMISISLMTMILLMGLAMVPLLFIEEKENHTIDALLVSPARFWQIVVGKLIAGGVYCLVAASIVLLFNYRMVVHWELMIVTVLLGTCFTVALGLLMGMIFENAASMGLWTSLLTILLLFSPLVQTMGSGKIPQAIYTTLSWVPSSAMYQMITQAMIGNLKLTPVWQGAFLLAGTTLLLSFLVVWRIRQIDK